MIRLTAKGLAKYMTSGHATQRKILWNYKHPDPEGAVQAKYYSEARHAIERYHESGNDVSVAVRAVESLHAKAGRTNGRAQDRIRNNIRALESYIKHFGKRTLDILPTPNLSYVHGQVQVSAFPDLYVSERGRHKIIKLDFSLEDAKPLAIAIVLQVTFVASQSAKLPVRPSDIVYVDIATGTEHKGARTRTRLMRDVEAACQTIEDVWPRL